MSVAEKTLGIIKAVFLYQDTMKAVREDMQALSSDISALGRAHGSLAERVARLEGVLQGAAMASGRGMPRIEE